MRAFVALLLVAVATAELAPLLKVAEPISGKYIVKLKDDVDVDSLASTVTVSGGRVGYIYKTALKGFAAALTGDILDLVRQLPEVEYVEEDGIYRTQAVGSWGLDRIDQRDLPLDDSYSPSDTGSSYTVYVIDTGVRDSHNDFGGRADQTWAYSGGSNEDCNGHGTHCSGTVGSNTYGVATGVQIRGVKVLSCLGFGSTSNIVAGIEYVESVADDKSVASMSLGGGASTSLDNAVTSLVSSGVPTAVAAGNSNDNACNYSPARASAAITVGATDNADQRSSFSCYGSCLDIFAPGTDITSTWHSNNYATNTISGTSMACPHVAGAIALYGDSASMINAASSNKISDTKLGSPNKLLYV